MFHFIAGAIHNFDGQTYITNDFIGIQVHYRMTSGELGVSSSDNTHSSYLTPRNFFLYPIIDEHAKTIKYYAFDTAGQKESFSSLLKISGIGPKVAFEIAAIESTKLGQAIENFDVAFFQAIPGIGPKTAKKILVELKSSFSDRDLIKINADDKLVANITKTLTTMGYEKSKILTLLSQYEGLISKESLSIVVQWLIERLK